MVDQEYIKDFDKLYNHFFDAVYRFVARRITDTGTVHDIVSETFIKIYTHLDTFSSREEGSLSSWIYTIAKNEIFQHLRKNKHYQTVSLEVSGDIPDKQRVGEHIDQESLHIIIAQVLRKMEEEDREVILYKYFDELGNTEIASLLDITANNVGVRLHRALQKLKKLLVGYNISL